jgi:hypothetical protein
VIPVVSAIWRIWRKAAWNDFETVGSNLTRAAALALRATSWSSSFHSVGEMGERVGSRADKRASDLSDKSDLFGAAERRHGGNSLAGNILWNDANDAQRFAVCCFVFRVPPSFQFDDFDE